MKQICQTLLLPLLLMFMASIQANERLSDSEVRSLLKQVAQQSILPIYSELNNNAEHLVATTSQFCDEVDEQGLKRVRKAWSETLSSWQQATVFLFGPATEDSIDFSIYFHPVKKGVINGFLSKIQSEPLASINKESVEQSGVGGQGLATVEYLLFDREQSEAEVLEQFTNEKTGLKRCQYLLSVEALLAENIQKIYKAWDHERGNYSEAFYTGGEGSAYFTKAYQPMELLVNRLYQAIQAVEIKKLGVPLGLRGSRNGKHRVYPYKLEAWRGGHSLQNVMSVLKGIERVFLNGGVLESLKAEGHGSLAVQLENQLSALLATKFASTDLFKLLENSPKEVVTFYEKIKVFSSSVGNELAPALGVQLGFNQNDGD